MHIFFVQIFVFLASVMLRTSSKKWQNFRQICILMKSNHIHIFLPRGVGQGQCMLCAAKKLRTCGIFCHSRLCLYLPTNLPAISDTIHIICHLFCLLNIILSKNIEFKVSMKLTIDLSLIFEYFFPISDHYPAFKMKLICIILNPKFNQIYRF